MVNDRRIAEAPAGDSDMRNSDAVASTDDCRSQAINKEVHHSSRDGRDSHDDVAVGTSEVAGTLTAYRGTGFRSSGTVTVGLAITRRGSRYLTPRECERLQGMPDDYTLVPFRKNKLGADSPRYKALGNSMAVPVMAWIGRRIARAFAKAGPHTADSDRPMSR